MHISMNIYRFVHHLGILLSFITQRHKVSIKTYNIYTDKIYIIAYRQALKTKSHQKSSEKILEYRIFYRVNTVV